MRVSCVVRECGVAHVVFGTWYVRLVKGQEDSMREMAHSMHDID